MMESLINNTVCPFNNQAISLLEALGRIDPPQQDIDLVEHILVSLISYLKPEHA